MALTKENKLDLKKKKRRFFWFIYRSNGYVIELLSCSRMECKTTYVCICFLSYTRYGTGYIGKCTIIAFLIVDTYVSLPY